MSFRCGFFNSINEDRKYNADDMNYPFKGMFTDGIFVDDSNNSAFKVESVNGMNVKVNIGQGVFADKWCNLDSDEVIQIADSHPSLDRIDSIFIQIDKSNSVRNGKILYKQGEPSSNPIPPEMIRLNDVMEYRLANISVKKLVENIIQADIEDRRLFDDDCGISKNRSKPLSFLIHSNNTRHRKIRSFPFDSLISNGGKFLIEEPDFTSGRYDLLFVYVQFKTRTGEILFYPSTILLTLNIDYTIESNLKYIQLTKDFVKKIKDFEIEKKVKIEVMDVITDLVKSIDASKDAETIEKLIANLKVIPIGFEYWQSPNGLKPSLLWESDNYTWTDVSSEYADAFVRVKGSLNPTGALQEEGLPNITGQVASYGTSNLSNDILPSRQMVAGALNTITTYSCFRASGTPNSFYGTGGIKLDASEGGKTIYGKSTHVTPKNYGWTVWRRTK